MGPPEQEGLATGTAGGGRLITNGEIAARLLELATLLELDGLEGFKLRAYHRAAQSIENHPEPLWNDLGRGYVTGVGYYVFSDRGDRVERLALGPSGYMVEQSGAYDRIGPASDLAAYVKSRDPKRIRKVIEAARRAA